MTAHTIAAHTPEGMYCPGYFNATRSDNGAVILTLRSAPKGEQQGAVASLTIAADAWDTIVEEAAADMVQRSLAFESRSGQPDAA